jgi:dynein heavy chain 1, cytosolic
MAEDELLDAINQNKGEILENDELIQKLERLKSDAAEMMVRVKKTDETLLEIEEVSNEYLPLAK